MSGRCGPVRVLLLDARAGGRAHPRAPLPDDARLTVVGHASSGEHAAELATDLQADVMLAHHGSRRGQMAEWIRHVMQTRPTPVVALAADSPNAGEGEAFDLLAAGALAVLRPPGSEQEAAELAETLRLMAEVKVVRRWKTLAGAAAPRARAPAPPARAARAVARGAELVAIGASTGGPLVLKQLLAALPATFPVPVVIVQHIAHGFSHGLAQWLSASCAVKTVVAQAGMPLEAGRAYLAPDGSHLRIGPQRTAVLDDGPAVNGHRPAVARLFASAAQRCGRRCVAILLTGMGTDGAAEMKQLRDLGAVTIAQDRESSVVHGMPAEAVRLGGAAYVMGPAEIAAALPGLVSKLGVHE